MRRLVIVVRGLDILGACWHGRPARPPGPASLDSDPPAETSSPTIETTPADEPQALMEQGLDHERQHNWAAAIETYRKAVEHWPSRDRVQPSAPALRAALQADPAIPGRELSRCSPAASAGTGDRRCTPRSSTGSRRTMSIPSPWSRWFAMGSTTWRWHCATPCSFERERGRCRSGTRHLAARATSEHEGPARGRRPNRGDRDCPVRLRACPPGHRAAADPRAARVHLRRLRCP